MAKNRTFSICATILSAATLFVSTTINASPTAQRYEFRFTGLQDVQPDNRSAITCKTEGRMEGGLCDMASKGAMACKLTLSESVTGWKCSVSFSNAKYPTMPMIRDGACRTSPVQVFNVTQGSVLLSAEQFTTINACLFSLNEGAVQE